MRDEDDGWQMFPGLSVIGRTVKVVVSPGGVDWKCRSNLQCVGDELQVTDQFNLGVLIVHFYKIVQKAAMNFSISTRLHNV